MVKNVENHTMAPKPLIVHVVIMVVVQGVKEIDYTPQKKD